MKTPTFASTILGTTLLILCNIGHSADLNRDSGKCIAERTKLLAQDIDTFDQSPEGWRSVAAHSPGCYQEQADLIAEYRKLHPEIIKTPDAYLLYWHEGQIRATIGQYQQAEALFEKSRLPSPSFDMWNLYVEANLAFVRRDRNSLVKARTTLAQLPPEVYRPLPAPMNLDVVDRLLNCFERTYAEAYRLTSADAQRACAAEK